MAHDELYPPSIPFRTAGNLSGAALGGVVLLILVGVASFFLAPSERAFSALLFNWLFWTSVAIGVVIFAVALQLTNARWAWSIRRFALGGVSFLWPAFLLLVPVFFGYDYYFHHWIHGFEGDPVLEAKAPWLRLDGMIIRDFAALAILFALATRFAYLQLRTDVHGAARTDGQRTWYERLRLTQNWRGVETEAESNHEQSTRIGVFTALAFAFLWGLIAIDLAMTALPHFFSTMFPVAFFVSAFHSALAMTILMVVIFRKRLGLEDFITRRQFHDLGKLLFAFAVFWMYINWSQYVVIWYGLLPHEQEFFVLRFLRPFGPVTIATVMLIFVVPFFGLLARPPKMVPGILAGFAVLILLGHWLERFLITVPSFWSGWEAFEPAAAEAVNLGGAEHIAGSGVHPGLPLGIWEVGVALGFLGLFMGCYMWYLRTFPVLPSPATLAAAGSPTVAVPGPTKVAEA